MNNLVNDKKFLIVGAIAVVLIVCYLIDQHIKNTVKQELKLHYNMKRKVKNKLMKQKQQRERNAQIQRQETEQYHDEQIDMDSYVDPVNNTHNEYEYDNQSERLKADNMYMRDIMDDL